MADLENRKHMVRYIREYDPEERFKWLREPKVPRDGTLLTVSDLNIKTESNNSEYRDATPAVKYRDKIIEYYGEKPVALFFQRHFKLLNTVEH